VKSEMDQLFEELGDGDKVSEAECCSVSLLENDCVMCAQWLTAVSRVCRVCHFTCIVPLSFSVSVRVSRV